MRIMIIGFALVVFCSLTAVAEDNKSALCLSCHDASPKSPIHTLLNSKHGNPDVPGSPMAERGCASCHGESLAHTKAPTKESPNYSFGPRWSATIEAQNGQCLACHKDDVAAHWQGGTHDKQQLTCVTCHDAHTLHDPVLGSAGDQQQVCTLCHKPQKAGIHALHERLSDNPACTQCHNPHAIAKPQPMLVKSRSAGCRSCHDLVAMSDDSTVSDKAKSYHRTMVNKERTCVDCHKGVAHVGSDYFPPAMSEALAGHRLTLFQPGQHNLDWLTTEHPGAQSVRQGHQCKQCHSGEEPHMGKSAPRVVDISFSQSKEQVNVLLRWTGRADDASIALMWSKGGNPDFSSAGCWASCHNDMKGMNRDRGQQQGKYLSISRAQMQRIGQPPIIKSAEALAQLMADGQYAMLWRVSLDPANTRLEEAILLDQLDWKKRTDARLVSAEFVRGRWQVLLQIPADLLGDHATFGMALHQVGQPESGHWISLPQTFSRRKGDADFVIE